MRNSLRCLKLAVAAAALAWVRVEPAYGAAEEILLPGGISAAFDTYGGTVKFAKDSGFTDFVDPRCPAPDSVLRIKTNTRDTGDIVLPCENWSFDGRRFHYADDMVTIAWQAAALDLRLGGSRYLDVMPLPGTGATQIEVRLTVGADALGYGPLSFCGRFSSSNGGTVLAGSLSMNGPTTACGGAAVGGTPTATRTPTPTSPNGTVVPTRTPTPSATPGVGPRTCVLGTGSKVVVNVGFPITVPLTGSQQWVVSPTQDANGLRTISIPASGTHFNKTEALGQTFCVRPSGNGTGVIDCDGGSAGFDRTAAIDHNTNLPPGANGGFPADPNCTASFTNPDGSVSTARLETGAAADPHANVCNGPLKVTETGSAAAGAMKLTETLIVRILSGTGQTCPGDSYPYNPGAGDQLLEGTLTTGTTTAIVYDADNNVSTPTNRSATIVGSPFGCANLDQGTLSQGKLGLSLPALDVATGVLGTKDSLLSIEIVCQ